MEKTIVLIFLITVQLTLIDLFSQERIPVDSSIEKPVLNDNINRENLLKAGKSVKEILSCEETISNLSSQQHTEIKELMVKKNKKLIRFENQLNEKKALLRTLETSDNPSLKSIYKLIEEIGKLSVAAMKVDADYIQQIRKLLTEEQRLEFDMKMPGLR
jgi:hypothetical protein